MTHSVLVENTIEASMGNTTQLCFVCCDCSEFLCANKCPLFIKAQQVTCTVLCGIFLFLRQDDKSKKVKKIGEHMKSGENGGKF